MGMAVVRRLSSWPIHELAVIVHRLDVELNQMARRLSGASSPCQSPGDAT